jgi:hypothetical protein
VVEPRAIEFSHPSYVSGEKARTRPLKAKIPIQSTVRESSIVLVACAKAALCIPAAPGREAVHGPQDFERKRAYDEVGEDSMEGCEGKGCNGCATCEECATRDA